MVGEGGGVGRGKRLCGWLWSELRVLVVVGCWRGGWSVGVIECGWLVGWRYWVWMVGWLALLGVDGWLVGVIGCGWLVGCSKVS